MLPRRPKADPDLAPGQHGGSGLLGGHGDKLSLRPQHATGTFVDAPRRAVEEAGAVREEAASRPDTERPRLALRQYRDPVRQLLKV